MQNTNHFFSKAKFYNVHVLNSSCDVGRAFLSFINAPMGVFGFMKVGGKWEVRSESEKCENVVKNYDLWK